MKKLITLMLIVFTINASAQRGTGSNDNQIKGSTVLMVGGVGFSLLGLTSCLDWDYVGAKQVYRPIYRNGNSTVAVVTGFTLEITGLITLASERRNGGRKRHARY